MFTEIRNNIDSPKNTTFESGQVSHDSKKVHEAIQKNNDQERRTVNYSSNISEHQQKKQQKKKHAKHRDFANQNHVVDEVKLAEDNGPLGELGEVRNNPLNFSENSIIKKIKPSPIGTNVDVKA